MKYILMLLILPLSGCGVYSTGFNCPDSKGARCVMLSQVDQMVNSGEIETVYLPNKQCRAGKCQLVDHPKQHLSRVYEIKLIDSDQLDGLNHYQDGSNLYLK